MPAGFRPLRFNIRLGLDKRIAEFPVFAGLQDALLHDLAMSVTSRFAVPGEWIYRRRQRAGSVCFISRGEVALQRDGHGARLTHGDFLGEAELLRPPRRQGRLRAGARHRRRGRNTLRAAREAYGKAGASSPPRPAPAALGRRRDFVKTPVDAAAPRP